MDIELWKQKDVTDIPQEWTRIDDSVPAVKSQETADGYAKT